MFRPAGGRNDHQYEADYNAIKGLQTLAGEFNIAVVIVHHTRKSGSEIDPFEKVSGTLGLSGAADAALKVPAEVREAAMALTPDAIRLLGEIMNDPKAPPATRVTAADKILDRALGRPAQSVEVKGEKRDLLEYSIADLVAIAYQRGMEGGSIEGEVVDASTAETSSAPSDAEPREYLIA